MKNFLKVFSLLVCHGYANAQCNPNLTSNIISGCAPLEVIFNCPNMNSSANTTFNWSVGTTTLAGGTTASFVFQTAGVFTVNLTVTSLSPACVGTASALVTILTGTANGCPPSVGVEEYLNDEVSVYPNPNSGIFTVKLTAGQNAENLIMYNAIGQKVHEENLVNKTRTIHCPHLAKGVYSVVLTKDENLIARRKVVIAE